MVNNCRSAPQKMKSLSHSQLQLLLFHEGVFIFLLFLLIPAGSYQTITVPNDPTQPQTYCEPVIKFETRQASEGYKPSMVMPHRKANEPPQNLTPFQSCPPDPARPLRHPGGLPGVLRRHVRQGGRPVRHGAGALRGDPVGGEQPEDGQGHRALLLHQGAHDPRLLGRREVRRRSRKK